MYAYTCKDCFCYSHTQEHVFYCSIIEKKYIKKKKKKEKANGKKNEDLKNFGKHARECRQPSNTRIKKRTRKRKK
jgi:hypothetical protein